MSFIKTNAGFIVKKKQDPKSKFLNGPISRSLRRKKLLTLFKLLI
jgi:ribosomal protein L14